LSVVALAIVVGFAGCRPQNVIGQKSAAPKPPPPPGVAATAPDPNAPKGTLAVVDFEVASTMIDPGSGRALADRLLSHFNANQFELKERAAMAKLMAEQQLNASDMIADSGKVAEFGKMSGVKYMVVGTVSLVGQTYTLETRMVDTTTGAIVSRAPAEGPTLDALLSYLPQVATNLSMSDAQRTATGAANVTGVSTEDRPMMPASATVAGGGRFQKLPGGAVYDKELEGYWYCPDTRDTFSLTGAESFCRGLSVDNMMGWRLPDREESMSLARALDEARFNMPALKVVAGSKYWTNDKSLAYIMARGTTVSFDLEMGGRAQFNDTSRENQCQLLAIYR